MKTRLTAWIVLFAGLLASIFAAELVRRDAVGDVDERFAHATDQIALKIRERLDSHKLILRGAAGLFAAAGSVSRQQLKDYVDSLDAEKTVPGLQGIGYAQWIPPDRLDAHIAAIRAEGFPDYTIKPPGKRVSYTAIIYLEPFDDRNRRAFGYDMYSEPVRRAAMAQARDSGRAALSGKVELVQEDGTGNQAGTLMYVPVYRKGMPLDTVEQRRAALSGWSYSPFRMENLMRGILRDWQGQLGKSLNLTLYDGSEASSAAMLFSTSPIPGGHADPPFYQHRTIDFNGHRWLLTLDSNPELTGSHFIPAGLTLAAGMVISGLLFWLIWTTSRTQLRAERMARDLTVDIRQQELLLRSILENVPIRVFWKDAGLRYLGGNTAFARDAGLSRPEDLAGKDDFQMTWREQAGRYRDDDRQVMDSGVPKLGYEEPQTTADGRTIWLSTSKVPLRDAGGRAFGILGIYADITERKHAEIRIRRLTKLYAALSECNAAVIQCATQQELFARICEVIVDLGGMAMAWIGLVDEAGSRIMPVALHGQGSEYLDGINISMSADDPHGRGPTGTAARENRIVWVGEFLKDPATAPWHERARRFGWNASVALPICRSGKPVGALTAYSTESGSNDEETRTLLEKMAAAINIALDRFAAAAEAKSYQATLLESEQRFRTLVEQSLTGAFIIQDKRFVYVNPRLAQILGHADSDALIGQSPLEMVTDRDRAMVEHNLHQLIETASHSTDFTFAGRRRDGTPVDVGISLTKALYQHRPAIIGLMQDISNRKVAEDRIRRYAGQLEQAFMQMVSLATTLSEMRDAYTAGHEKRVAEIAVAIGSEMGLAKDRLEGLRVGGYLHDVGKVAIPTEILAKPGKLSAVEFELIKTHATAGYEVLKNIEFPWPVAQIALQHHERLDGSGYPNGLKGDQIILEARITAVADVVESMASHRPYRPAIGLDRALDEIERGAGSIYDPAVVEACLRLFREQAYTIPR